MIEITLCKQFWCPRKKSNFRRLCKKAAGKARKSWGVRRTYGTPQRRRMQRNAASGLFTKPSILHDVQCGIVADNCLKYKWKSIIMTSKSLIVYGLAFFFTRRLQPHTAQHFIKIFPIRNELGDLFVKLFGMVFVFDVSQFVNDDVINRCKG